jgi:hypothetical protein
MKTENEVNVQVIVDAGPISAPVDGHSTGNQRCRVFGIKISGATGYWILAEVIEKRAGVVHSR